MCRVLCTLCVLSVGLTAAVGSSADPTRHPARAGSFVHYAVYSVDDLVGQVSSNPTVAKRYASHFGISKEKLAVYFKENLKVVTLRAPVKVTTYFISKHGRIASKQRTLPAGRQVFVTVGNKAFIEIGCGNPVTKQMPVVKTEVKPIVETVGELPVAEVLSPPAVEVLQPEVVAQLPIEVVAAPAATFGAPSILKFLEVAAPVVAGLQYVRASKDTETYIPEPSSFLPVALASMAAASAFVWKRRAARR